MSVRTLAIGAVFATTLSLIGSRLAMASGQANPIQSCSSGTPGALQVLVYSGTSYTGQCWVLELKDNRPFYGENWAGYDTSEGFPNDTVQSVKVGSSVRLRMFWNWFNQRDEGGGTGGAPFTTSISVSDLGSPWDRNASAARVELGSADLHCGNPTSNYIMLWDDPSNPYPTVDCTTLNTYNTYHNAVSMAYRNDNASAFWTDQGRYFYGAYNEGNWLFATPSGGMGCGTLSSLPACGLTVPAWASTTNADNQISSIAAY